MHFLTGLDSPSEPPSLDLVNLELKLQYFILPPEVHSFPSLVGNKTKMKVNFRIIETRTEFWSII